MSKESAILKMAKAAKKASRQLAVVSTSEKNKALRLMAKKILAEKDFLIRENAKDMNAGEKAGLSKALLDRLLLTEGRV